MTVAPGATASVLFVCTANRVRSPFAAAVARRLADERRLSVEIGSAGFLTPGHPADRDMSQVARRRGIDLSEHSSRRVDAAMLERSDLVVAMTGRHVIDLVGMAPTSTRRILTLRELAAAARSAPPAEWSADGLRDWADGPTRRAIQTLLDGHSDTADPIGRPMRHYRSAADEIEALTASFFAAPTR